MLSAMSLLQDHKRSSQSQDITATTTTTTTSSAFTFTSTLKFAPIPAPPPFVLHHRSIHPGTTALAATTTATMTSAADWPQDDSMPNIVSSNDLFDGDILGEELIDIYGAASAIAEDGAAGVTDENNDKSMTDVTSLLCGTTTIKMEDTIPQVDNDFDADDVINDGLGAFRPSTSFNDLSKLLSPSPDDTPSSDTMMSIPTATTAAASASPSPLPPIDVTTNATAPVAVAAATTMTATALPTAAPATTTGTKRGAPSTAHTATQPSPTKRHAGLSRKVSVGATLSSQGVATVSPTGASPIGSSVPNAVATTHVVNIAQASNLPTLPTISSSTIRKASLPPTLQQKAAAPVAAVASAVPATALPVAAAVAPRVAASGIRMMAVPRTAPAGIVVQPKPAVAAQPRPQQAVPAPQQTAPGVASLQTAATEADFKSVAQAAVSSLIVNATAAKAEQTVAPAPIPAAPKAGVPKINVSTEHVKALTGSNWVSVCGGGSDVNQPSSAADKANNRARRQNLTPDERARQNRDRNREHARNTRLRKKAYVEELKRTLVELVTQRDATDLETRQSAQRELEQREVRFRVIEEFLKLRGHNQPNAARWAAILDDGFTLTLPVTDFRKMVQPQCAHAPRAFEQVLTGVAEVMADSTHCANFLQTLGKGHAASNVSLVYHCDRKDFFMDNCNAVLEWVATTSGAVEKGAASELSFKGTVKASFSPASNKLLSAAVSFDTGIVLSQLNHLIDSVKPHEACDEQVAAQYAANEADAILDSLQMPRIESAPVPTNVNVVPESSCSEASSIKGECSDVE